MKRVQTQLPCPVCKAALEVQYRKPTVLTSSFARVTCPVCRTDIRLTVKLKPGGEKQVEYRAKFKAVAPPKDSQKRYGIDPSIEPLMRKRA